MSYGQHWERFPIEPGEIWATPGGAKISAHDITTGLPDYMRQADMIYSDPPWTLGNVNMFNGRAGRAYMNSFDEFHEHLFRHIRTIAPRCCYLEIGAQNLDLFACEMQEIFSVVQQWEITYYKTKPCFLLRGGDAPCSVDFTGMDDAATPGAAVRHEAPRIVADFCTGRGLTAMAAFNNGCGFVGTELNKRKLAALISRSGRSGNGFQKTLS